jgi:hypothetical protein
LLLTADGAALSNLLSDLLLNEQRRTSIGNLARSTADTTFSWRSKGIAFDRLLRSVSPEYSPAVETALR